MSGRPDQRVLAQVLIDELNCLSLVHGIDRSGERTGLRREEILNQHEIATGFVDSVNRALTASNNHRDRRSWVRQMNELASKLKTLLPVL
jgi:hypothetical protein